MKRFILKIPTLALLAVISVLLLLVVLKALSIGYGFDLPAVFAHAE